MRKVIIFILMGFILNASTSKAQQSHTTIRPLSHEEMSQIIQKQKKERCKYIDCYENDSEVHITDKDGYLFIRDQEVLEKYVARARKALLNCKYFENNYLRNWLILIDVEQKPNLIKKSVYADDGYQMSSQACGQWTGLGDTYYRADFLNDIGKKQSTECYWESVIIHEVLHTAILHHTTKEEHKNFYGILDKCNFLNEATMTRWFFESPVTPGRQWSLEGQKGISYDCKVLNKLRALKGQKIDKSENQYNCM